MMQVLWGCTAIRFLCILCPWSPCLCPCTFECHVPFVTSNEVFVYRGAVVVKAKWALHSIVVP